MDFEEEYEFVNQQSEPKIVLGELKPEEEPEDEEDILDMYDRLKAEERAERRQKRKGEGLALVTLCVLFVGIGISACLLVQNLLDSDLFQASSQESWSQREERESSASVAQMPEIEVELQRAPIGDGTQLTFVEEEGESLSLQEIYQNLNPAVVAVRATGYLGVGTGTGVIFSQDGYIITNAHVIADSFRADVVLADGRTYEALLVGQDESTDLAVLKIEGEDFPVGTFASSDSIQVGDSVSAIGNPFGEELRGTLTSGIISAINRDMVVEDYEMTLIQTTAALNPGNSGGPLINDQGNIIGITNMKLMGVEDTTVEGLGFAIPSTTVQAVANSLIEYGVVTGRPMLGIVVQQVATDALAERDLDYGLWVIEIEEKASATQEGLQVDDIILTANGIPLYSNADLLEIKEAAAVGDQLTLEIYRDGVVMSLAITVMDAYMLG